ncbi:MAG: cupin domain-containing protein [Thomasclavelia sp.]|nr:cupin domain-containing protein [Thomasclavelia sp.]
MKEIDYLKLKDSIYVEKESGTNVNYYIFDEFEIHINVLKPHTIQEWHYHSYIDENIVVTKGKLHCRYIEDNKEKDVYIGKNEVLRVLHSTHTIENDTDEEVEFIVFRFIPQGKDNKELIKSDKTVINK